MKRLLLWVPAIVVVIFLVIFASGLRSPESRTVPSGLVGKPLPAFKLDAAMPGEPGLSSDAFRTGKPKILNLFASWCVPCAAEAPHLLRLQEAGIEINAVAIRDKPADIGRFLERHGNPYHRIGADPASAVQISLGSSGVPESFIVDGKGVIRYQHIGDIRAEDVDRILAMMKDLQ